MVCTVDTDVSLYSIILDKYIASPSMKTWLTTLVTKHDTIHKFDAQSSEYMDTSALYIYGIDLIHDRHYVNTSIRVHDKHDHPKEHDDTI